MNRDDARQPQPAAAENYLHEFLRIFFANKRLIIKVFLAFAIVTLLLPLFLTKQYDVPAEVIVLSKKLAQSDASEQVLKQDSTKYVPPSISDMETESNILRSRGLVRGVVASLHQSGKYEALDGFAQRNIFKPLKENVAKPFKEGVVKPILEAIGVPPSDQADSTVDGLTDEAVESLTVETVPGSNVISVTYRVPNADFGKLFVDALLDEYLNKRFQLQSAELPASFYQEKRAQYQARLDQLEVQREKLLDSIGATSPNDEVRLLLDEVAKDAGSLNSIRDRKSEQGMWLSYLKERLAVAKTVDEVNFTFPFTFANTVAGVAYEDREIRLLEEDLAKLISQYGNQASTYRSDSKRMILLGQQIARARDQFIKTVEGRIREREREIAILATNVAKKEERIAAAQKRSRDLRGIQSALRQLDTEIDALHSSFASYTQRVEESRTNQSLDNQLLSNSRVLSRPYVPTQAAFPKPKLLVPLGLLTALMLALAAGYLREFFDHTFKHSSHVTQRLGLPVLMTLDNMDEEQPIADDLRETVARLRFWKRHRR